MSKQAPHNWFAEISIYFLQLTTTLFKRTLNFSSGLVDLRRQLKDSFNLRLRKTVQETSHLLVERFIASFVSSCDLKYIFFLFR